MTTVLPDGAHVYLSTACYHGEHGYCAATERPDGTGKRPAECKFCGSPCLCACHIWDEEAKP